MHFDKANMKSQKLIPFVKMVVKHGGVKVKVSHGLIAVGAVGVSPTVSWAQLMKGGAYPSPFASLSFPNSKKVPIHCWVNRESFPVVGWRSPASNSRPYGDFLHHIRAALTTRQRRLSWRCTHTHTP